MTAHVVTCRFCGAVVACGRFRTTEAAPWTYEAQAHRELARVSGTQAGLFSCRGSGARYTQNDVRAVPP